MGGASSFYKININGLPGHEVSGIDMNANDSVYVFVTMNLEPNAATIPFIIKDSIQISFNGQVQYVQLGASGQNAHYLRHQLIFNDTTSTNALPYVILGFF